MELKKDYSCITLVDPSKYVYLNRIIKSEFEEEYKIDKNCFFSLCNGGHCTFKTDNNRIIYINWSAYNPIENNELSSCFERITISRADKILNHISDKCYFYQDDEIVYFKKNKNEFIFYQNGKDIRISVDKLKKYIEISFNYVEVLFSDLFWDINKSFFLPEHKNICLSLFKNIDKTVYPNYDDMVNAAKKRKKEIADSMHFNELAFAIEQNDVVKISKLKKHINKGYNELQIKEPLWYYAIKNQNLELLNLIIKSPLKYKSFYFFIINDEKHTPMSFALKEGFEEGIQSIIKNKYYYLDEMPAFSLAVKHNRVDIIFKLLEARKMFYPDASLNKMNFKIIKDLSVFKTIKWLPCHLKKAYKNDITILKKMLKSLETIEHFNEYHYINNPKKTDVYYQLKAFEFIIETKNINLYKYISNLNFEYDKIEFYHSATDFALKGIKIRDKFKKTAAYNYETRIQRAIKYAIKLNNINIIKDLIENFGGKITYEELSCAGNNLEDNPNGLDVFIFCIDHFYVDNYWFVEKSTVQNRDNYEIQKELVAYACEYNPNALKFVLEKYRYDVELRTIETYAFYYFRNYNNILLEYKNFFSRKLFEYTELFVNEILTGQALEYSLKNFIEVYADLNLVNDPIFYKLLKSMRKLESNKKLWAQNISTISKDIFTTYNDKYEIIIRTEKLPNNIDVLKELLHIYSYAEKLVKSEGFLISYDCKRFIETMDEFDIVSKIKQKTNIAN